MRRDRHRTCGGSTAASTEVRRTARSSSISGRTNPVALLKPVKVPPTPTLPFDEVPIAAILEACDRYPILGVYNHKNRKRMKVLTLLLRYSGRRVEAAGARRADESGAALPPDGQAPERRDESRQVRHLGR